MCVAVTKTAVLHHMKACISCYGNKIFPILLVADQFVRVNTKFTTIICCYGNNTTIILFNFSKYLDITIMSTSLVTCVCG